MIYKKFAKVYDRLMSELPPKSRAEYVMEVWRRRGNKPKLVLDLACGTGAVTELLAKKGFEMIGVDVSAEMLSVARARKNSRALYVCQDMRAFELYGTVDSIICLCDSLNYLSETADLRQVFALCANYLNHGGVFIFDVNTEYKFKNVFGNKTFAAADENAAYVWENQYFPSKKMNEYNVTFFAERKDGLYERFEETHHEHAFSMEEISNALTSEKFRKIETFDGYSFSPPADVSERIVFVAERI